VRGSAYALVYLAPCHLFAGEPDWRTLIEECVTQARQAQDPWVLGMALWTTGTAVPDG
jgi:hypothetical protein